MVCKVHPRFRTSCHSQVCIRVCLCVAVRARTVLLAVYFSRSDSFCSSKFLITLHRKRFSQFDLFLAAPQDQSPPRRVHCLQERGLTGQKRREGVWSSTRRGTGTNDKIVVCHDCFEALTCVRRPHLAESLDEPWFHSLLRQALCCGEVQRGATDSSAALLHMIYMSVILSLISLLSFLRQFRWLQPLFIVHEKVLLHTEDTART
jgi:hypothetical protein